jgi:hypothetical protein
MKINSKEENEKNVMGWDGGIPLAEQALAKIFCYKRQTLAKKNNIINKGGIPHRVRFLLWLPYKHQGGGGRGAQSITSSYKGPIGPKPDHMGQSLSAS